MGTAVGLPYMAVAGVGLRTVKLVGTAGVKTAIAGEALLQLVEPNPSGGLATVPLLVQHLVPNFDLIQHSFDAGLVEGQDVEEPCVLLVVPLRPDWLVGSLASSEASWQLVDQMVVGEPAGVVGEDSAGEAAATGVGFAGESPPPAVWVVEESKLVVAEMGREVS